MARGKAGGRYTPGRRDRQQGGGQAGWLTTYGDMVTLLLAFFVLLYSMSSFDVAKFEAFVSGLAVPFGNTAHAEGLLPGSDGFEGRTEASATPPLEMAPPASQLQVRDPDVALEEDDISEGADTDATGDEREHRATLEEIERALDAALSERGLADLVQQRREERGLVVTIASDDVLFALGSTEIDTLGEQVIATVSTTLERYPNDVLVEGHTDDVPLQRVGYTNWNLSTDRAVAVLSRMIDRYAFPPDQIGAVGYGEYRPYQSNETTDGRARNRRVDIVVLREEIRS